MNRRDSPNFGPRRGAGPIDMVVLHYTGMPSAAAALDRLCDPAAEVSAHYLIAEDGTVWQLVEEAARAWHAGRAFWAGECDVNSRSIGIELDNPGHGPDYRGFPDLQMAVLAALLRDLVARHPIPPHRILGHSDVAPDRKLDPGERFDWRRLAAAGLGLWPQGGRAVPDGADPDAMLRRFGYADSSPQAIAAFQRHFRPSLISGAFDRETVERLADLLEQAGLA